MSRYVYFQPIDVSVIQNIVFPYIRGTGTLDAVLSTCRSPLEAVNAVRPLHDAYQAHIQGHDFHDLQWGRCDPVEFITDGIVRGVLSFAGHLHPNWSWNYLNTAFYLADDPIFLECFEMPITLFEPLIDEFPQLSDTLESIVTAEEYMGGVAKPEKVPQLCNAFRSLIHGSVREPENAHEFDAMVEIEKALSYAAEHRLSYTEMVE